jgi:hypothetical protein
VIVVEVKARMAWKMSLSWQTQWEFVVLETTELVQGVRLDRFTCSYLVLDFHNLISYTHLTLFLTKKKKKQGPFMLVSF